MANFIVTVDPDHQRRSRFMQAAQTRLPFLDGLVVDTCHAGNFAAAWAASPQAPISSDTDSKGCGIIWGHAIAANNSGYKSPRDLRNDWIDPISQSPLPLDGYHAALTYDTESGLTIGADLLGLFPVYYYANHEFLLAGSSPELFRLHPRFRMRLNPQGLVEILLLMHAYGGETLLQGVRRLAPGHLLRWQAKTQPREVHQYSFPASEIFHDSRFDAHIDVANETLATAVNRQVPPGKPCAQLFSGGLDSRMLAGYLTNQGTDITALTLGRPDDIERTIACRVATALGIKQRVSEVPYQDYPAHAETTARWEHVNAGFNGIFEWGVWPRLQPLPNHLLSGYLMGDVLGLPWFLLDRRGTAMGFDGTFNAYNTWGFPAATLSALLHADIFGEEMIRACLSQMREHFNRSGDTDFHRGWQFGFANRQRFHLGGNLWRYTFGSWPVLPFLDREVLKVCGGMPLSSLAKRRLQKAMLRHFFPELAALPLDRNAYKTRPSHPPLAQRMGYMAYDCLPKPLRRLHRREGETRHERRYYYRIYDINNAGWRAVRRRAEPARGMAHTLFNKQTLATILPPPDQNIQLADGIKDASGIKTLMGFMLWAENHL